MPINFAEIERRAFKRMNAVPEEENDVFNRKRPSKRFFESINSENVQDVESTDNFENLETGTLPEFSFGEYNPSGGDLPPKPAEEDAPDPEADMERKSKRVGINSPKSLINRVDLDQQIEPGHLLADVVQGLVNLKEGFEQKGKFVPFLSTAIQGGQRIEEIGTGEGDLKKTLATLGLIGSDIAFFAPGLQGSSTLGKAGLLGAEGALSSTLFELGEGENIGQAITTGIGGGLLGFGLGAASTPMARALGKVLSKSKNPKLVSIGKSLLEGRATKQKIESVADEINAENLNINLKKFKAQQSKAGMALDKIHKTNPSVKGKFSNKFGMTPGEYVAQKGIYKGTEDTIADLAVIHKEAMRRADDGLSRITGNFQDDTIGEMIGESLQQLKRVSPKAKPTADLSRVTQLSKKYNDVGLSMSEINEVKRIFERNNQYAFVTGDKVTGEFTQRMSNIGDNLREWQRSKASELGFSNLADINKETMMSKSALDAIGNRYLSSVSNNAVSLTDWILASEAITTPGALGALGIKKALSNDQVQSRLTKFFVGKDSPIQRIPEVGAEEIQRLNIQRAIKESPAGLPSPRGDISAGSVDVSPIRVAPRGSVIDAPSDRVATSQNTIEGLLPGDQPELPIK